MWIKNKDRKYLYLDLQNGIQWKKKKTTSGHNNSFAFPHEHFSWIE